VYQKGGEVGGGRVIRLPIETFEVQIPTSAEIWIEISASPVLSQLGYDAYIDWAYSGKMRQKERTGQFSLICIG